MQSDLKALDEKLKASEQKLQELTAENAVLQKTLDTERAAWTQDKKLLEDTIADMTLSGQTGEDEREAHANEVRQLEEKVKSADERYSREVLSHADAIKALETLRQQLTSVQNSARDSVTAAETATAKLASSESSWKQQKESLSMEAVLKRLSSSSGAYDSLIN